MIVDFNIFLYFCKYSNVDDTEQVRQERESKELLTGVLATQPQVGIIIIIIAATHLLFSTLLKVEAVATVAEGEGVAGEVDKLFTHFLDALASLRSILFSHLN